MISESKALLFVLYNFALYFLHNANYQQSVLQVATKFAWSFYNDVIHFPNLSAMPEQSYMTVSEIAMRSGYAFEEYRALTDDGYILTIYRIPGKLTPEGLPEKHKERRQPVQLQHGLFDQGGTWFFNEPEKSLPFKLVDQGYDVWITNTRGTSHSNMHKTYRTSQSEYWNFTIHEIAKYDVPGNLKFIQSKTGFDQIVYMGHSQGTTQFFIANVLYPELYKNYKAFVGMAPVLYVGGIHSAIVDTLDMLQGPEFAMTYLDAVLYLDAIFVNAA
jgi:pimeloyl-ACP methyl ester carboxylesterase